MSNYDGRWRTKAQHGTVKIWYNGMKLQKHVQIKLVGPKGQNYRPEGLGQNTTGDFDSRSKGEAIIAELLMARKIVFQFEWEFRVKLNSGQIIVLHLGRLETVCVFEA